MKSKAEQLEELAQKCTHRQGHVRVPGTDLFVKCPCYVRRAYARELGDLFTPEPHIGTALEAKIDTSLLLLGSIGNVRRHAAGGVLYATQKRGRTWIYLDGQKIIHIYVGEHTEFRNMDTPNDRDLMVLYLGFGDLPNRKRSEVIKGILDARQVRQNATWVYTAHEPGQLVHVYGEEVSSRILDFEETVLK